MASTGPRRKSVTYNLMARTFSGSQQAPLANNSKRFGDMRAAFSTSTPYPPTATFYGEHQVPRSELWTTSANKMRAQQEVKAEKNMAAAQAFVNSILGIPKGGKRKTRKSRKASRKTRKQRRKSY